MRKKEYNVLFNLVTLERQLNLTWGGRKHSHSLIADIRRIGTVRNIQHVCGPNLKSLLTAQCRGYLALILKAGSKIGQQIMFYCVQNERNVPEKREVAARLLATTTHPTRWLMESLAHEMRKLSAGAANNKALEVIVLQTLSILSQSEQLIKLKEMLSTYTVDMLGGTGYAGGDDLVDVIANLDNFTVVEHWRNSQGMLSGDNNNNNINNNINNNNNKEMSTLWTLQFYRHFINRFQVQAHLANIFAHPASTCQVKQEVVQLLIDNVDQFLWEEAPTDRRWPKYGFNKLDQIFAKELE